MSVSEISLGPSPGWKYCLEKKNYDLSRGSNTKLILPTKNSRENDSITVDPSSTALVIVDMQNIFLHPRSRDSPLGRETVEPVMKTVRKCREYGIQVSARRWYILSFNERQTHVELQAHCCHAFRSFGST
jgi:hypothetical protein